MSHEYLHQKPGRRDGDESLFGKGNQRALLHGEGHQEQWGILQNSTKPGDKNSETCKKRFWLADENEDGQRPSLLVKRVTVTTVMMTERVRETTWQRP